MLNEWRGSKSKLRFYKSHSTARVILGQVLSIATCGTRIHRGDSLWLDAKLTNHYATEGLNGEGNPLKENDFIQ